MVIINGPTRETLEQYRIEHRAASRDTAGRTCGILPQLEPVTKDGVRGSG